MKKTLQLLTILITSVAFVFMIASCANPLSDLPILGAAGSESNADVDVTLAGNGETAFLDLRVLVPTYRISSDRNVTPEIIDPGTEYLRLYLNGVVHGEDVPFGTPQPTPDGPVQNLLLEVPVPLSGAFESVRIDLLSPDGQVLTRGENRGVDGAGIPVSLGELTPIAVACFPTNTIPLDFGDNGEAIESGALVAGETVYFTFPGKKRVTYGLLADAGYLEGDIDLYLFDAEGRLVESGEMFGDQIEEFEYITADPQKYYIMAYALTNVPEASLTVTETNQPPVAIPGQNVVLDEPGVAVFDGSASFDPEGANIVFEWVIDDDLGDPVAGPIYGPVLNYNFEAAGTYTVILIVSDGDAAGEASVLAYVEAANVEPVAAAPEYIEAKEGDEVTFDGSDSYDPNGDPLTYEWTVYDDDMSLLGTYATEVAVHTFTVPGIYTAELVVADEEPLESDPVTVVIEIYDNRLPTPLLAEIPEIVSVNEVVDLDATFSFDVDDEYESLTFTWDIFDSEGGSVATAASGDMTTHTFIEAGEYAIVLTVIDPLGDFAELTAPIVVESVYSFDVTFAADIDVNSWRPVVVVIAEVEDLNGDETINYDDYYQKVAERYLTTEGAVSVSTAEIPGFSLANTYIALAIHDVNDTYNPVALLAQTLSDQHDFIGAFVATADELIYDTTAGLAVDDVSIEPDTPYSFTMDNETGYLNLVVQ